MPWWMPSAMTSLITAKISVWKMSLIPMEDLFITIVDDIWFNESEGRDRQDQL